MRFITYSEKLWKFKYYLILFFFYLAKRQGIILGTNAKEEIHIRCFLLCNPNVL